MFRRQAIIALFLLLAACGRPEFGTTNKGGGVITTDVDRADVNGAPGNNGAFFESNNAEGDPTAEPPPLDQGGMGIVTGDFAFDAYRQVAASGRNAIIAPHGLARSLVVAHAAASPETAAVVAGVVEPYLGGDIYERFNSSDLGLDARQSDESFRMLASVWVQDDVAVESDFVDILAMYLGLQLRLIDFMGSPEDARNTINNWYSTETDGRISEVIGARTLEPQTRFIVTDATWFSASWGFGGFDPAATTYAVFAGTESNVQLPMMRTEAELLHFGGPDLEAVVLPFDNGFSLVAVLPENLEAFEAVVEASFLDRIIDEAVPQSVSLSFPRIEVSDRVTLSSVAGALGVDMLFAPETEYSGFADETRLDDAHQRSRIAFDEQGATGGVTDNNATSPPEPGGGGDAVMALDFDRPFFFGVRDSATGAYLFLGRLAQP